MAFATVFIPFEQTLNRLVLCLTDRQGEVPRQRRRRTVVRDIQEGRTPHRHRRRGSHLPSQGNAAFVSQLLTAHLILAQLPIPAVLL